MDNIKQLFMYTGINIKNSNNNYYADARQTDSKFLNNDIPNSTKTNIDNYLNNDNNKSRQLL